MLGKTDFNIFGGYFGYEVMHFNLASFAVNPTDKGVVLRVQKLGSE